MQSFGHLDMADDARAAFDQRLAPYHAGRGV
jgi:hypothetical protein